MFFPERLVARLNRKQEPSAKPSSEVSDSATPLFRDGREAGDARAARSGNLLTGQLYVAFDAFPNAPKAKIDWSRDPTELPVVPSTVSDIEAKLTNIVAKLDKLPLDAIGDDLRSARLPRPDAEGCGQGREPHRRRGYTWLEDDPR